MLARLILVILLAAFAIPAAAPAACHDATTPHATMAMTHDPIDAAMPAPPSDKAMPLHGCIGCIPPSNWLGSKTASIAPADTPVLIERATVLDIGMAAAPVPPPPRAA